MKFILFISLLFSALSLQAQEKSLAIILPEDQQPYEQALELIQYQLAELNPALQINLYTTEKFSSASTSSEDLIVTLGEQASEFIQSADVKNQVINAFVQSNNFTAADSKNNPGRAAIVTNQPLQKLVSVADKLVAGESKNKIIILVSETNTIAQNEILKLQPLTKGVLEVIKVAEGTLAAKTIDKNLFNAAALVTLYDSNIWAGKSAKLLLYQAFNYRVPIIGYSRKFLDAGALISVYSPIESIASDTVKLVQQWLKTGHINKTGIIYSNARIDYNVNIARALNLPLSRLESLSGEKQ